VQWGDVPTWLASVGAVVAGGLAFKVYRIEGKRDRKAEEDQRRLQAARVSGWFGLISWQPDLPGGPARQFWKAKVRNLSDLPIYDVQIEFHKTAMQSGAPFNREVVAVLPPGDDEFFDAPDDERDYVIALRFRDAAGVAWYRDARGFLSEIH
jgi:hypothetical protein